MLRAVRAIVLRVIVFVFLLTAGVQGLHAADASQPKPGEPTDPKARKTFDEAAAWERQHMHGAAVTDYRKANKQDGGICSECLRRAYQIATSIGDFKSAEAIAREWLLMAATDVDKAAAHYRIAIALQQQGVSTKKEQCFNESCDEFKAALSRVPDFTAVHYCLGTSLAYLHQDDAARAEFAEFLNKDKQSPTMHERAARYLQRIDLARARMAPAFTVTTLDGQRVTMDSLAGKVVLIDFWATWCGPCREALPHIHKIVQQFQGQPLVVLSISLDSDMERWRAFVNKNDMTWLQYRDGGGASNSIADLFGVHAIPATFTIDADGVLEDQHVGDADIEGKLKKLIAHASEVTAQKAQAAATTTPPAAN